MFSLSSSPLFCFSLSGHSRSGRPAGQRRRPRRRRELVTNLYKLSVIFSSVAADSCLSLPFVSSGSYRSPGCGGRAWTVWCQGNDRDGSCIEGRRHSVDGYTDAIDTRLQCDCLRGFAQYFSLFQFRPEIIGGNYKWVNRVPPPAPRSRLPHADFHLRFCSVLVYVFVLCLLSCSFWRCFPLSVSQLLFITSMFLKVPLII